MRVRVNGPRFMVAGALVLCAALSCSSILEPRSGVTLLVTNGTCVAGHCDSLRVLGFPGNQPHTPGGLWSIDLGLIVTPQSCLVVPRDATFRVIGPADTVTFTWTSAMALSLGAPPASSNRLMASPSTTAFVPAEQAGWQINLPAEVHSTPSLACTP